MRRSISVSRIVRLADGVERQRQDHENRQCNPDNAGAGF